jgi:hypothetical protein
VRSVSPEPHDELWEAVARRLVEEGLPRERAQVLASGLVDSDARIGPLTEMLERLEKQAKEPSESIDGATGGERHESQLRHPVRTVEHEVKPHIVKRVDHPLINVLPEVVGRGALPSGELRDAAKELDPGEAALIVVGEPTLAKGFDKAVTRVNKVAKESFDASADTLADELIEAAKR